MLKVCAVVILALCALLSVIAANECYATDRDALENGNSNVISIQNCGDYMRETFRRMNLEDIQPVLPTNCFTVQVIGGAPLNSFKVKGCVPKGMCSAAKRQVMAGITARGLRGYLQRITCDECLGNNCNGS